MKSSLTGQQLFSDIIIMMKGEWLSRILYSGALDSLKAFDTKDGFI